MVHNLFRIATYILIATHIVLHLQDKKKFKKNINFLESIQLKKLLAIHQKLTRDPPVQVAVHSLRNAGVNVSIYYGSSSQKDNLRVKTHKCVL